MKSWFALAFLPIALGGCYAMGLAESARVVPVGGMDFSGGLNATPLVLDSLNDADADGVADFPLFYASGVVRGGIAKHFDLGTRFNMVSLSVDLRRQLLAVGGFHVAIAPELQGQFGGLAWAARLPIGYRLESGTELVVTPRVMQTFGVRNVRDARTFVGGTTTLRVALGDWLLMPEVTVMQGIEGDAPLWPTYTLSVGKLVDL